MPIHNLKSNQIPSFKEQLNKQICYLENSCLLYDNGNHEEAIRIATSLRVLFHDTSNSTSLLKYLNATSININSTIGKIDLNDSSLVIMFGGMYYAYTEPDPNYDKTKDLNYNNPDLLCLIPPEMKVTYYPVCIVEPCRKYVSIPVNDWINQTIIKLPESLTRRELYLGAANTDGGAHVDEKQKKIYSKMAYEGGFGLSTRTNPEAEYEIAPIEGMHLLLLRQMAHEVLSSPELRELLV